MKFTLAILFLVLCGFSAASVLSRRSEITSTAPTLVWMTDINPTRADQLAAFQKWLIKTHGPPMQVRLDETMVGQSDAIAVGIGFSPTNGRNPIPNSAS